MWKLIRDKTAGSTYSVPIVVSNKFLSDVSSEGDHVVAFLLEMKNRYQRSLYKICISRGLILWRP